MSLLQTIDPNPGFESTKSVPTPERLIAGDPAYQTWLQDTARGNIEVGVWEATPGTYKSIKGEVYEFCHILQGLVEITADDTGETTTYRAGDNFVLKPGFTGNWKTIETVRKIFVVVR